MTAAAWVLLGLAAVSVGVSKTAVPGLSTVSVAVFAAVLPAKESTGLLLLLLLVGDLVAVGTYWRQADWRLLSRLLLPVVAGVLLGVVFLVQVDDLVMRRTIGVVLLALLLVRLVRVLAARRAGRILAGPVVTAPVVTVPVVSVPAAASDEAVPGQGAVDPTSAAAPRKGLSLLYGSLAGFTTMVANSGGPVMSLYMLSVGVTKLTFLGTAACFFFAVNLVKLPFSVGLSLVDAEALRTAAVLAPLVLLGTWAGRRIVRRIDQRLFERLVVLFTLVAGLYLLR